MLALFGDGSLRALPGGIEEYLARRTTTGPSERSSNVEQAGGPPAGTAVEVGPGAAAAERAARKELARLERRLQRLAVDERRLLAELAEHAADYGRVADLDGRLRAVRAERDDVEDAWLRAAG